MLIWIPFDHFSHVSLRRLVREITRVKFTPPSLPAPRVWLGSRALRGLNDARLPFSLRDFIPNYAILLSLYTYE